jgi:hypothetical protein
MLKYMIPAINEYERVELLKGIKANALQPAFNAIMILTQSLLSANDWEHLQGIISTIEKKPEVWEAVA